MSIVHNPNRWSLVPTASLLGFLLALGWLQPATAEDFRVESKVFTGQDDSPTSESLTLFADGRAYDFLRSPREITVFDLSHNRITVLDPSRKLRTEVTGEQLNTFSEQLRTRAARQTDALLKFAAEPKFDESHDNSGWLRFGSPVLTYRVHALKVDSAIIVRQYRQFCDASARLNSMLHPGAMPPFPRLAVNVTLERGSLIPEQVEVTFNSEDHASGKPTSLRSEHILTSHLLPADRGRIDEANQNLAASQQVSLEEYLRPVRQAKR